MKVILPIAGKGTRMKPFTLTKPKPLLPVAGKAVLDHILKRLAPLGVSEYIFITGHLKEQIEDHVKKTHAGLNARFLEQTIKDGTAGAVRTAANYIDEPVMIVFAADTIFDADLSEISSLAADGLMWAQPVENYWDYGVIVHDDDKKMLKIVEKPKEPVSKLANIGVYYIKNYELLLEGINHIYKEKIMLNNEYFLTDAFQYMIDKGANLQVRAAKGWYDTGKPDAALRTNQELLAEQGLIQSNISSCNVIEPVFIAQGCELQDCTIGPHVTLMSGCKISGATIKDSIIDKDCVVTNAVLDKSILGEDVTIIGSSEEPLSVLLGDCSVIKK